MARGKGADVLSLDELMGEGKEGALVDVVLEPGQASRELLSLLLLFFHMATAQLPTQCDQSPETNKYLHDTERTLVPNRFCGEVYVACDAAVPLYNC